MTAIRKAREMSKIAEAAFLSVSLGKLKTIAMPIMPAATPMLARATPFR